MDLKSSVHRKGGTAYRELGWGQLYTEPHARPISCHVTSLPWQEPEEELNKFFWRKSLIEIETSELNKVWLWLKYYVCIIQVPSVLWRCWLGGRKGIRLVKHGVVGCWHGYPSGAKCRLAYAQLMPLQLTVSCFSKIQIGFTFLVPTDPGSPGKRAVKQVCVCVCVCIIQLWVSKGMHTTVYTIAKTVKFNSRQCECQCKNN